MKGLLWKGTVMHNRYSETNSKNLWGMPLSYPEAFELSVELHIAKFTGRYLSQVSLVQVFSYEFWKTFKNSYNICERLLLAAGCRTTQKLSRRDLLFLPFLVCINISVGSSFFFFYLRFFYAYLFWFLKLDLQTENYMEDFGRL